MLPLTLAAVGQSHQIKRIGGNIETKKFLENIGLTVGASITIIQTMSGNVIVKVKESRVAISREMAGKIMV